MSDRTLTVITVIGIAILVLCIWSGIVHTKRTQRQIDRLECVEILIKANVPGLDALERCEGQR